MGPPRILSAVLVLALCPGCALFVDVPPLEPLPRRRVVLDTVEYTPQAAGWDCGPACLTAVMRYYGSPLTLDQVTGQLKQRSGGGIIVPEMLFGARENGFRCKMYEGDINDLRRRMLDGKPLILMLYPTPRTHRHDTDPRGHYVVAVGYDDRRREAIIHTGDRSFARMSYRRLQQQWSRARFRTFLIER